MEIRLENEITYCMVPSPLLEKLEPFFQENKIEYRLLFDKDIPEGIPKEVNLDGHISKRAVCCVESHMNSDDVNRLVLKAWRPSKYGTMEEL